ncbi:hypothetical protein FIBSPDRAFT_945451 [Athelia psychrophila]|uniref:Uncharacterized protein n=1 Tax=Athelia psychrophila TaxID=1759441 RepID=A0A166TSS1_9AGAM|nr:hypothetical protein FIBSPDRAFT_945451 [Fibularhizoctonia sp. CBS 109695]
MHPDAVGNDIRYSTEMTGLPAVNNTEGEVLHVLLDVDLVLSILLPPVLCSRFSSSSPATQPILLSMFTEHILVYECAVLARYKEAKANRPRVSGRGEIDNITESDPRSTKPQRALQFRSMCTMGEAPGPCTREGNPSQVAHREPHVAQYFTFTCLALAFSCSWALTLTILCAVPALILIQGVSQALVGPLVVQEQTHTAIATGKSSPLPVQNPCARQDIRRAEPCGEKLHMHIPQLIALAKGKCAFTSPTR